MGCQADIIAIGPFLPSVVTYLDYPEEHYRELSHGTPVVTTVLYVNTTDASKQLAQILGFNLWDLNEHCFCKEDLWETSWQDLFELLVTQATDFNADEAIKGFQTLAKEGFMFYFRPNG